MTIHTLCDCVSTKSFADWRTTMNATKLADQAILRATTQK